MGIINSPFSCTVGISRVSTIRDLQVDDDVCILRISN